MANANPPDKVDNGKTPGHGNVDAPDSHTHGKQIGDGQQQDHDQEKGHPKAYEPAAWRAATEGNSADLISHRGVGIPGRQNGGAWLLSCPVWHLWSGRFFAHHSPLALLSWCLTEF